MAMAMLPRVAEALWHPPANAHGGDIRSGQNLRAKAGLRAKEGGVTSERRMGLRAKGWWGYERAKGGCGYERKEGYKRNVENERT